MKTLNYLSLCLILLVMGCQKNEDFLFDENRKDINIWFGISTAPVDSTAYNFSHSIANRDSVMFNYRLMGYPLDHDVTFELEAVDGDIDLVYFSFGNYTIKAGNHIGQFPIYFDKPENYNEFKDKAGKIRFRMKENQTLKRGAKELSDLKITLHNGLSKPADWDVAPLYYQPLATPFGTYSSKKHALIIQVSGRQIINVFINNNDITRANPNAIPTTYATYYRDACKAYLVTYEKEHGEPLEDENGNTVVFP